MEGGSLRTVLVLLLDQVLYFPLISAIFRQDSRLLSEAVQVMLQALLICIYDLRFFFLFLKHFKPHHNAILNVAQNLELIHLVKEVVCTKAKSNIDLVLTNFIVLPSKFMSLVKLKIKVFNVVELQNCRSLVSAC